ncbi:MAG: VOC family protein [Planctomycetes bacterium]|nr:VOC family protein [Planctomycetota bacterium]
MVTPKKNDSTSKSAATKPASSKLAQDKSASSPAHGAKVGGAKPANGKPATAAATKAKPAGATTGLPGGKSKSAPAVQLGAKSPNGKAPSLGAKAAPGTPAPKKLPKRAKTSTGRDIPNLFRLNLEVGDLDAATRFYERLLGIEARKQAGGRVYFSSGAVTLQVVQVPPERKPHPSADSLHFAVADIDAVYERAKALGCLSRETVHGRPGGEVHVRPWGERSFYARDRWKNALCFVAAGTEQMG